MNHQNIDHRRLRELSTPQLSTFMQLFSTSLAAQSTMQTPIHCMAHDDDPRRVWPVGPRRGEGPSQCASPATGIDWVRAEFTSTNSMDSEEFLSPMAFREISYWSFVPKLPFGFCVKLPFRFFLFSRNSNFSHTPCFEHECSERGSQTCSWALVTTILQHFSRRFQKSQRVSETNFGLSWLQIVWWRDHHGCSVVRGGRGAAASRAEGVRGRRQPPRGRSGGPQSPHRVGPGGPVVPPVTFQN